MSNIATIIQFKQEINEAIDRYIEILKTDPKGNYPENKYMIQVVGYFDRMRSVHSSQQSDDDEEDIDDDIDSSIFVDDNDDDNIFDDDDHENIMNGRFFSRLDVHDNDENKLRKQLLGFNDEDNELESVLSDSYQSEESENDSNTDPINNIKKNKINTVPPETEIEITDDNNINYDFNEPSL